MIKLPVGLRSISAQFENTPKDKIDKAGLIIEQAHCPGDALGAEGEYHLFGFVHQGG